MKICVTVALVGTLTTAAPLCGQATSGCATTDTIGPQTHALGGYELLTGSARGKDSSGRPCLVLDLWNGAGGLLTPVRWTVGAANEILDATLPRCNADGPCHTWRTTLFGDAVEGDTELSFGVNADEFTVQPYVHQPLPEGLNPSDGGRWTARYTGRVASPNGEDIVEVDVTVGVESGGFEGAAAGYNVFSFDGRGPAAVQMRDAAGRVTLIWESGTSVIAANGIVLRDGRSLLVDLFPTGTFAGTPRGDVGIGPSGTVRLTLDGEAVFTAAAPAIYGRPTS